MRTGARPSARHEEGLPLFGPWLRCHLSSPGNYLQLHQALKTLSLQPPSRLQGHGRLVSPSTSGVQGRPTTGNYDLHIHGAAGREWYIVCVLQTHSRVFT